MWHKKLKIAYFRQRLTSCATLNSFRRSTNTFVIIFSFKYVTPSHTIRTGPCETMLIIYLYDTVEEFNVDSKAEYSA